MKFSGIAAALALTSLMALPSFAADTRLPAGKPAGTKQALAFSPTLIILGIVAVIAITAVVASSDGDNETVTTTGTGA